MTPAEAARIAAAVSMLRPEWGSQSVKTILLDERELTRHRPMQDVAVAIVYVALDPDSRTPARVHEEQGPWWSIGRTGPSDDGGVRGVTCPKCRDTHMPTEEDHICVRRPDAQTSAARIAELRAALRAPSG